MSETFKYLFGPVPSRRLGRSLGVDLIPFKTCTMNCRFCQLGDSDCALSERAEYVSTADVLSELARWKELDGEADHITLAGSGEPTLHMEFGEILRWIRNNTNIPSVLLSNGSLFHLPEVRAEAARADKVKVTLSAWDDASFRKIHNPARGVTFEKLVAGERAFRAEFSGELSIEVFIVSGMNSEPGDVKKIAALVETINPDRIDLNTAVRPPADSDVQPVSAEQLTTLANILGSKAEVVASFKHPIASVKRLSAETLLSLIQRHPATAAQLADDYGTATDTVTQLLKTMVATGQLYAEERDRETYYFHRS